MSLDATLSSIDPAARALLSEGFTQEQSAELSVSITRCFGGSGSFSDYTPGHCDKSAAEYRGIPGTENFETFARITWDRAINLRAIPPTLNLGLRAACAR